MSILKPNELKSDVKVCGEMKAAHLAMHGETSGSVQMRNFFTS